jgi:hypothetical protein
MGADKILLEGDGDSNKTNTASNTRFRLTTQVGQAYTAIGVLLDLGTNKQPPEPNSPTRTTKTCATCCLCCTGQTDGLRRSDPCHRSDRWTKPVRSVATAVAQQVFQRASVSSLGTGTKTPPKHNLHGRETLHKA